MKTLLPWALPPALPLGAQPQNSLPLQPTPGTATGLTVDTTNVYRRRVPGRTAD